MPSAGATPMAWAAGPRAASPAPWPSRPESWRRRPVAARALPGPDRRTPRQRSRAGRTAWCLPVHGDQGQVQRLSLLQGIDEAAVHQRLGQAEIRGALRRRQAGYERRGRLLGPVDAERNARLEQEADGNLDADGKLVRIRGCLDRNASDHRTGADQGIVLGDLAQLRVVRIAHLRPLGRRDVGGRLPLLGGGGAAGAVSASAPLASAATTIPRAIPKDEIAPVLINDLDTSGSIH